MATHSRIAIENPNGSVKSVYCHNDGYPSYNGRVLLEHYSDRDKVERLIELGVLSSISEEVEPTGPHSFSQPARGVVIAYHRDRGEDYRSPDSHSSIKSFASSIKDYSYVFTKEGQWLFIDGHKSRGKRAPVPLEEVI